VKIKWNKRKKRMIYLDIDGVLILDNQNHTDPDVLARAQMVADLARDTNCCIIISSQRRISMDVIHLMSNLGLKDHLSKHDDWKTPFLDDYDDDLPIRGQQIDAHLQKHNPAKHVVLDDDYALHSHNQILIDPKIGLTKKDINQAKNYLLSS